MYDGDEGKSNILRTELVHGSENVVDLLVQFMHKATLRIDVCADYTRPGLEDKGCVYWYKEKAGKNKIHHRNYKR